MFGSAFSHLRQLDVSSNNLTGTLPPLWARMWRLQRLVASNNMFQVHTVAPCLEPSSTEPLHEVCCAAMLLRPIVNKHLRCCCHRPHCCTVCQGGLPEEWGSSAPNTSIPSGLAAELEPWPLYMRSLRELECNACGLSGSLAWITRDWHAMHSLRRVSLARNSFSGLVPTFGALYLQELNLSDNPLFTNISPWWAYDWPALHTLALAGCNVSGTLPGGE